MPRSRRGPRRRRSEHHAPPTTASSSQYRKSKAAKGVEATARRAAPLQGRRITPHGRRGGEDQSSNMITPRANSRRFGAESPGIFSVIFPASGRGPRGQDSGALSRTFKRRRRRLRRRRWSPQLYLYPFNSNSSGGGGEPRCSPSCRPSTDDICTIPNTSACRTSTSIPGIGTAVEA